jgi:transcriptional regulator with XRE-family HTH domain
MEDAGQKLKRARQRLNLRYRDVEEASLQIAEVRQNEAFGIALSRLADIENKGTVPTIFRLYSLCAIYRLDLLEVLSWYRVDPAALPADAGNIVLRRTHLVGFAAGRRGETEVPLAVDPGLDLRRTSYLSRVIRRWGKLPLSLLHGLDGQNHRYALIGSEDWFMYPLVQPGALAVIDETRRKIVSSGWTNEFERPIYFFEHRQGCEFGWCTLTGSQLILQPHPASMCVPRVFGYPEEIDVVGQIVGVATILTEGRRRHTRA